MSFIGYQIVDIVYPMAWMSDIREPGMRECIYKPGIMAGMLYLQAAGSGFA